VKLDDIHREWERDAAVDEVNLDRAASETPKLHAKYLRLMSEERMIGKKLRADLVQLEADVESRILGTMSREDLERRGWRPEQRRILKPAAAIEVSRDPEVIDMRLRAALQDEKVEVLESIVKMVMNRNFVIKSMIDWQKFKAGA
jgi:recombination/repair/ssDNA binding protein UvsY